MMLYDYTNSLTIFFDTLSAIIFFIYRQMISYGSMTSFHYTDVVVRYLHVPSIELFLNCVSLIGRIMAGIT